MRRVSPDLRVRIVERTDGIDLVAGTWVRRTRRWAHPEFLQDFVDRVNAVLATKQGHRALDSVLSAIRKKTGPATWLDERWNPTLLAREIRATEWEASKVKRP